MNIGILSVRSRGYHPNRRLLEAARGLGHRATIIEPRKLLMRVGPRGIGLDRRAKSLPVHVLLPRMGSTVQTYPLTAVRHFQLLGIPVINPYEAIILARNKFVSLQNLALYGIPVPESAYVSNWDNFKQAVKNMGGFPVVVKTVYGRQGEGVFLFKSMQEVKGLPHSLLPTAQGLVVQAFIHPEGRRDIRALVIGDRVAGAMALTPRKCDFRANIHLHGRAERIRLSGEMTSAAVKATRALGLEISGVDMIEEKNGTLHVIEVNYSPGFRGLEKCTGKDIAVEIIQYATHRKGRPL